MSNTSWRSRRPRIALHDMDRLLPILFEVAADWPIFMGQLGFPQERIKQIERDTPLPHEGRSVRCLITALQQWAVSEAASYETIVRTLRGPLFKNEVLARKVENFVASDVAIQGVASNVHTIILSRFYVVIETIDQFDETMTAEDLFEFLRLKGVHTEDCDLLKGILYKHVFTEDSVHIYANFEMNNIRAVDKI